MSFVLLFLNFLVLAVLEPLAVADGVRQLSLMPVRRRTTHHQLVANVVGVGLVLPNKLELLRVNRQRVTGLARHLPDRCFFVSTKHVSRVFLCVCQ